MINLYIPGNRKFTFIRTFEDGTYEYIDKHTFFALLKTEPDADARVIPDFEADTVYFVPASTGMAQAASELAREVDTQKKRDARHYGCIFSHTTKCNGWKKDNNGQRRCDFCNESNVCRTISLDKPVTDDDGNQTTMADCSDFAEELPIDASIEKECDRELLRMALATLPPEDRRYITDRYSDGMNFTRLAEMYGLNDRTYASKKAGRIEARLKLAVEKLQKSF